MAIKILDIYGQNVASKRMGIECRINQIDSIIFVAKWIQIYGSNIEKRGFLYFISIFISNDALFKSRRNIILLLIVSIWQYYLILCITIARHSRFISNPPCLISSKLHSFLFSYSSYFLCAIHLPLTFWFIKSLITCNPIATAPS